jgi:hypothetical protein
MLHGNIRLTETNSREIFPKRSRDSRRDMNKTITHNPTWLRAKARASCFAQGLDAMVASVSGKTMG